MLARAHTLARTHFICGEDQPVPQIEETEKTSMKINNKITYQMQFKKGHNYIPLCVSSTERKIQTPLQQEIK